MLAKIQLSLWDLFKKKPSRQRSRISKEQNDPLLEKIWIDLAEKWFPEEGTLKNYKIVWSKRSQIRTLASCNIESKKVNVARELNYPEHHKWIEPLLYHEMCHAVIGYVQKRGFRSWHGREFKTLEQQHPQMKTFDLWVKSGGWLTAVRSDRGKRAYARRN